MKDIRVAIDLDTLGGTLVQSEFELYGSISATSLAGVFDLKDRMRFNKQFLEAKKLFKGAGFKESDTMITKIAITDTASTDTAMVDSVSIDTTNRVINDIPTVSDTVTSALDSLNATRATDTLNTSLPDTMANDTTSVVQTDSAAVKQDEEINTEEEGSSEQTDNTP